MRPVPPRPGAPGATRRATWGSAAQHATRTRSWREAKRHEDTAPRAPERQVAVDEEPNAELLRGEGLAEAQAALGVVDGELAELFGVAAPALEEWRPHGVPAAHAATLRRVEEVNRRLHPHHDRSPAEAVRVPVPGLGGRPLLDVLGDPDSDVTAAPDAALAAGVSSATRSP